MKPNITVVCGIILNLKSEILITQISNGNYSGFWEFPGGKLEKDESEIECLQRELEEELCIEVDIHSFFCESFHEYPEFLAHLIFYLCSNKGQKISLKVHEKYEWVRIEQLLDFEFLEADYEIINKIQKDERFLKKFRMI